MYTELHVGEVELKDSSRVPDEDFIEAAKAKAKDCHKRDESRIGCLREDFGEYLTEEASAMIAQEMIGDIKLEEAPFHVSVEKAAFDDDEVFVVTNANREKKLIKSELFGGSDTAPFHSSMQKAVTEHKRDASRLASVRDDMKLWFDEEQSREIAEHLMSGIDDSLQLQLSDSESESGTISPTTAASLHAQIGELKEELHSKDREIERLKKAVAEVSKSKIQLVAQTSATIQDLRVLLKLLGAAVEQS